MPRDVSNQYLFSRLRLKSNGIVNDLGWYVDNINLLPKTITSIETTEEKEIGIYPNPTSNYVNIANENNIPIEVEIYDLSGNLLFHKENFLEKSINISNLQSGLYLVKFNHKTFTKVEKLTVIK